MFQIIIQFTSGMQAPHHRYSLQHSSTSTLLSPVRAPPSTPLPPSTSHFPLPFPILHRRSLLRVASNEPRRSLRSCRSSSSPLSILAALSVLAALRPRCSPFLPLSVLAAPCPRRKDHASKASPQASLPPLARSSRASKLAPLPPPPLLR